MSIESIKNYALDNWHDFQKSVTELSDRKDGTGGLVEDDFQMYSFDDIVKNIFSEHCLPTSVDGMWFAKDRIIFVEFKSGFQDKIDFNHFDPQKAECENPHKGIMCQDHWKLMQLNRKNEKKILRDDIKLKAVESYIAFEKRISQQCAQSGNDPVKISLWVVVDVEPTEGLEAILGYVAKNGIPNKNVYRVLKDSLKRYQGNKDENGICYYYDEIKILSASEFKSKISLV